MPIPLSSLNRTQKPDSIYFDEERELYEAFKRHYKTANKLADGDSESALYALYSAMECFLKDIYCIARSRSGFDPRCLNYLGNDKEAILVEKIGARFFKHNLRTLANFLSTQIPELKDSNDFTGMSLLLTTDLNDWVEKRYRNLLHTDSAQRFEKIQLRLSKLIKNEFRDLVPRGDI